MKVLLTMMLFVSLYAKESFITQEEYARQLYHNPRGIGCHLCHGESGEGRLVAEYVHKNEKKKYGGPAIAELGFERFSRALNSRVSGMPRYFLTPKEIKALYFYLQAKRKKANDDKR